MITCSSIRKRLARDPVMQVVVAVEVVAVPVPVAGEQADQGEEEVSLVKGWCS